MNPVAWALLAITGLVAVADWAAVARPLRRLEYAAKPAVMAGLIGVALVMHPVSNTERAFFIAALVLGLASDVFLMLPKDMFLMGLVAALIEHVTYIAGFRARDFHGGLFLVASLIALVSVAIFLPPILRALRTTKPKLVVPVIAYVVVFVVMVASAGGSGSLIALAGALLFLYSDALLAWYRFVKPLSWGRFANIIAYHSGQALLVLSLAF
ncbi:MAG: lysoplasmalogenase [Chloroflexi bacterium]|nr:MAG: lysoplasmalogenase [Chloroflexota bacterium]